MAREEIEPGSGDGDDAEDAAGEDAGDDPDPGLDFTGHGNLS
jgi:hypothetical protein